MSALAKQDQTASLTPIIPATESAAVLSMIERAARDPATDIDKMLRLMEMRKDVLADVAEREFDDAMAAAQSEMEPVRADSNNPQTRSRYASYAALDRAIRPIYTKHGFAITFDTDASPIDGCIRIVARISRGGCRRFPKIDMPADGKGAKGGDVMTKTHATGSAASYGMRYLLKMIFNLAVSDRANDDGNAAGSRAGESLISDEQVERLQQLIVEVDGNLPRLFAHYKITSLSDLPAARLPALIEQLEARRK